MKIIKVQSARHSLLVRTHHHPLSAWLLTLLLRTYWYVLPIPLIPLDITKAMHLQPPPESILSTTDLIVHRAIALRNVLRTFRLYAQKCIPQELRLPNASNETVPLQSVTSIFSLVTWYSYGTLKLRSLSTGKCDRITSDFSLWQPQPVEVLTSLPNSTGPSSIVLLQLSASFIPYLHSCIYLIVLLNLHAAEHYLYR